MEIVKFSRRDFLKTGGAASAVLVLGFCLPAKENVRATPGASFSPNAFLALDADGKMTIWMAKSEMGQGVRTSLPMIVAEELEADWSKVSVVQADFDPKYGDQVTGGSLSVRTSWEPLRKAGATAREMLVDAAARKWGVEKSACHAEQAVVIHAASGRRLSYGELAEAAAQLPVPADVPLKDPKDFRIIGRPLPRNDLAGKVNGSAIFGLDVKVPGMLYAAIARCPVFGGELDSYDDSNAKAVPGVRQILRIEKTELLTPFDNKPGGAGHRNFVPGGVAVVGDSTWAAVQGRDALQVKWKPGASTAESSAALRERFEELTLEPGGLRRNVGDVAKALEQPVKTIEAVYEVPFLAHADMEPVNCTAHVVGDRCEVWAPSQNTPNAAADIAYALKIPQENIRIHITYLGGGFGRRLNQDYAVEAALVSKAAGAPVKVVWTREDDIRHDYYRPASCHYLRGGIAAQGRPIAWLHRAISPSIATFYEGPHISPGAIAEVSSPDFPAFAVPNFRLEFTPVDTAVPRGWWRSVENSANCFAVESFFDELAAAARRDPLEMRLEVLGTPRKLSEQDGGMDIGRMRKVIETAAARADWGKPLAKGSGRGLAMQFGYGSYVAQVAQVSFKGGGPLRVERIVCVVDCGQVVNPDTVAAQMEGGIAFGLSAALSSEITIEGGAVKQSNFDDYEVLRMRDMPKVEVHIIPSREAPGGCGEPPVPPVAPAVANAIFAATGKRIRHLPIRAADLHPD